VGAFLAVPILLGGELFGVLVLTHTTPRAWPVEAIPRLRGVGEIFANILARKTAEGDRRTVEALNSAVLASLPGTTAILDRDGTIVRTSGGSQGDPFAGLAPLEPPYLGRNYLELCRERCEEGDVGAAGVHQAVASVLAGDTLNSVASYAGYDNRGKLRWFEIWIARLARRESGAVITAFDVTARKEAELEAARNRDDLAHLVRVVTMGELATSFAHELKQPLTAIMANAQAARRMLSSGSPDSAELSEILSDIVRDDRRASDVLQRTSALLRKGHVELQALDLNELVRDVLGFLHSDLLLHQVDIVLELGASLPQVKGDRIHLQQVMLNVMLNAVDALERNLPGNRQLTIRTEFSNGEVRVSIIDNGPGIPADKLDRVFDAFYSTKTHGLGMGLSIARTILAAHGGQVWASNNPGGGATLQFGLPAIRQAQPVEPAAEGPSQGGGYPEELLTRGDGVATALPAGRSRPTP
jgi:signal transduction histidine kinase